MTARRMRRAILHAARDLRIESAPLPEPGPGELLLELETALVGGTARKVFARGYHERMGHPPLALGHEGVGRVIAIGAGVRRFSVGQRVVPANAAPCTRCASCARGLTAQCQDMLWLGGFLATHLLVPDRIAQANTYALPDAMDAGTAALAENLACVLKGRDRTTLRPGQEAVVVGAGPMGLLWTWALTQAGGRVTSVARTSAALRRAREFGAVAGIQADALEAPLAADLIVEAVGTPEAWQLCVGLARPGATVHLFGGPPRDTRLTLDAGRLHYDELTLTASFHHTPFHFAEALRLLAMHGPELASLIGETIPLDALPARLASDTPILKLAVDPQSKEVAPGT